MKNKRVLEIIELINITNKLTGDYKKDIELIGGIKNATETK